LSNIPVVENRRIQSYFTHGQQLLPVSHDSDLPSRTKINLNSFGIAECGPNASRKSEIIP